jgi:hypothetical protein
MQKQQQDYLAVLGAALFCIGFTGVKAITFFPHNIHFIGAATLIAMLMSPKLVNALTPDQFKQ